MPKYSTLHIGVIILLLAILACNTFNVSPTAQPAGLTPLASFPPPVVETASALKPPAGFTPVESLYDENFSFTPAERITINELELTRDALRLLGKTGWNGNKDMPLPISCADFDPAQLSAYVADEESDLAELTIPADLEVLYVSQQAASDLTELILQAHSEYLDYLSAQGTRLELLEEIRQHTLPADPSRMVYHPENDPDAPPSATEGLVVNADGSKDYSQLQMNLYPVDIYNRVMMLQESGLLGTPPSDPSTRLEYQRKLRDMAARQLVYHEMTHAVQRAYINLHVPANELTNKSAWIAASKTLTTVDTQYHWLWGGHVYADANNRHVSDESQAEGISFEVFVNIYHLSDSQQRAVWDYFFGRLENARNTLTEIRSLFETHYPEFSADEFGDPLYDVMESCPANQRSTLSKLTLRLSALPAYIGYLNPMQPQDTVKFWEVLRQP